MTKNDHISKKIKKTRESKIKVRLLADITVKLTFDL